MNCYISSPFGDPVQLIETGTDGNDLILIKKALDKIKKETRPVVVITIIGTQRTGKSYLMNRLMGRSDGFPLGSTMEAKTKGFWLWSGDFPGNSNYAMVLIDVEGLADPMKGSPEHDLKLFTLSLLASSMFIYNTMGNIDANSLNGLHLATKMVDLMIEKDAKDETINFGKHFPHFVFAIRDHFLELQVDGESVSSDEFLEHCLKEKVTPKNCPKDTQTNIDNYNKLRETLRKFFPSRNCLVFPRPADDENMTKLDQISESELKPKFVEEAEKFVDFVMSHAKPKQIKGSPLNGKSFALMFENFLESVNKKNISIGSTYQIVANEGNRHALELGIKTFKDIIGSAKLPMGSTELNQLTKKASETATNTFFSTCIDIESNLNFKRDLEDFLEKDTKKIQEENLTASSNKSLNFLESLYAGIDDKSNRCAYLVDGGYDELMKDMKKLKLAYKTDQEEFGPSKLEVLAEFERQKVTQVFHFNIT